LSNRQIYKYSTALKNDYDRFKGKLLTYLLKKEIKNQLQLQYQKTIAIAKKKFSKEVLKKHSFENIFNYKTFFNY
jgi:hypothetical protein